ncbi:MAG TPA: S-methyl-5-thioribose-1-phosphate isomerase [Clostridiales bacterium]|nr:S-methyl-5-thioribose-1-phosphate isomerase [Clostridiales bacterium]
MIKQERPDHGLAFMLQYENIAWYEAGAVRILDRRVYPGKVEFVTCRSHREVARAITDMVTQSAGPFSAAAMGMALAAWECRNKDEQSQMQYLIGAAEMMVNARPTTRLRMQQITDRCLAAAKEALVRGGKVDEAIRQEALTINDGRYRRVARIATYLADMFPNRGTIMTQCFGETIVGMMLRESKERGKVLRVFCPETRPYFQGARLTATVVRDMGFDVTVITDNMPAYVMKNEQIDVFTSAADAICADGHVVNKIGTYQIAITAHFHGVPYFVTGAPDIGHPTVDTIHIEMRDPEFVLQAMGVRTAAEGVKGYYPSFDITPPHLVSGVVTDLGIFAPLDLARYFEKGGDSSKDLVV